MKFTIISLIILLSLNTFSQETVKPELATIKGNSYYFLKNELNKKTLIFLHGGVNNPYFNREANQIEFEYLIEGNLSFVKKTLENGFNLIVPISNDSLNWLKNPKTSLTILEKMLAHSNLHYDEIYISGFSDGGTGSYKIFYSYPYLFDGLIVFNGFPQQSNFNKSVNYDTIANKKILFLGTYDDKLIPYEFLLNEYYHQKKFNANTYIYLSKGDHSFSSYEENDITLVFDILTEKNTNTKTDPIQGFIKNDELVEFYPFRKKIVKKYKFGMEAFDSNQKHSKE